MRVSPNLSRITPNPAVLEGVQKNRDLYRALGTKAFQDGSSRVVLDLNIRLVQHESRDAFYVMCSQLTGIPIGRGFDEPQLADLVLTAIGARGYDNLIADTKALYETLASGPRRSFDADVYIPYFNKSVTSLLDEHIAKAAPAASAPADIIEAPATNAPKAAPRADQRKIEKDPAALAALCKHYGCEKTSRDWSGDVWLRRDTEQTVGTVDAAVAYVRGEPQLIRSVEELLVPNVAEKLKAMGFKSDTGLIADLIAFGAASSAQAVMNQSNRCDFVLKGIDDEGRARVLESTATGSQKASAVRSGEKLADPKPFERTVQFVSIDFDAQRKPEAIHIKTYSWPPAGMPGINCESISHYPGSSTSRIFLNASLSSSIALTMSQNLKFAE